MRLKINGEVCEVAARTVLDLLTELGLEPKRTVVERNAVIVDYASYQDTAVAEDDILELVGIVGGG